MILEMDRGEALATWEAHCAARAFLANYEQDAAGIENSKRLMGVITRLFEAIPDEMEGRD